MRNYPPKTKLPAFTVLFLENCLPVCNAELKVTWKLHIVLSHVEQFFTKQKSGQAKFAEQTIESVLAKFKGTWGRYKVASVNRKHGQCLKQAVVDFSFKRI